MALGSLVKLLKRDPDPGFSRTHAVARQVADARSVLPEDLGAGASHSLGLRSRQGYATCNDQELLFGLRLAQHLAQITQDKTAGRCPKEVSEIAILLGDEELPGDKAFRNAFYEVVVAALKRSNIIYLPFSEGDYDANIAYTMITEHASAVVPKTMAEILPLPKFEIRFVGVPLKTT